MSAAETTGPPASAPEPAPAPIPDAAPSARRGPATPLRLLLAVLLFAGAAVGTASAVASLDRAEVPGLAELSDDRWEYPGLKAPPLPEGAPRVTDIRNAKEVHHADPRALVLPPPRGGRPVGPQGWAEREWFLGLFAEDGRKALADLLVDYGVRHLTARGWTMPDGTRTRIVLLRFPGGVGADAFTERAQNSGERPGRSFAQAVETEAQLGWVEGLEVGQVRQRVYQEVAPRGRRTAQAAWLQSGDTVAVIVQDRAGKLAAVPFRQAVVLQSQLLA